jgi:formamidopyrimidine-DNA glycosylase
MPELPEVETIVSFLRPRLVGLVPLEVKWQTPKIFPNPELLPLILGYPIKGVSRKGKLIFLWVSSYVWLIHLKMTGQLWWVPKTAPFAAYTHLWISFVGTDYQLRYADLRKFGYWQILPKAKLNNLQLGPDALTITSSQLAKCLKKRHAPIKTILLNQKCLAGLGNIYSDEALWLAKIHPLTSPFILTSYQLESLAWSIHKILRRSLRFGGASIRNYIKPDGTRGLYQNFNFVYQREGEACFCCRTPIKRLKIGGRSSYFCCICQKQRLPDTAK